MITNLLTRYVLTTGAIILLLWGFLRYRNRFIRMELIISASGAMLLGIIAYAPLFGDFMRTVEQIEQGIIVVLSVIVVILLGNNMRIGNKVFEVQSQVSELTRSLSVSQAPQPDECDEFIQVVIPAYNESETIDSVLASIPKTVHGLPVIPLVVSDGSDDNTAQRAKGNSSIVIEHPINQGQGGALKTGFEIAMQNGASVIVTMDADGQHPAEELDQLVQPILEDEADYVMGSRYLGSDRSKNGLTRKIGIKVFNRIINIMTKSSITDCTNGFRAIRGSRLNELSLKEEKFSAPELIIEARKKGLRIKEIPITIEQRQAGETKKPKIGYALGLTRTILTTWLR